MHVGAGYHTERGLPEMYSKYTVAEEEKELLKGVLGRLDKLKLGKAGKDN